MAEESHYKYSPSVPAAVIFTIVFVILLAAHLLRIIKTRTWFCTPFIVGCIFEIIGYGARAYGHSNPISTPAYIVQALLILLAPILFAASIYMFLSRIIRFTGCSSYSIIKPTKLTKIFVAGDILCFLVQAVGGAILAASDTKKSSDLGKAVILAGLLLQIGIFGIFMTVGAIWHKRMRNGQILKSEWDWERYMWMLYIVSAVITVRNMFRVIEYAMGEDGYLLANEWPIYVFDALLMAIVLAICCLWYVGDITNGYTRKSTGGLMVPDVELGQASRKTGRS